ncbi:host-nuclease inhibitor Gam family protein [Flammeovirga aprica]|uniref:Host-nuclease inhibitor protein Gam n=1 Tax=Flammeovirga aprica JL-4 TaxID=694437 RepID=A0A7X9RUN5_9BACT|nr:host-nuclease inhibitor Gam family protein [Flammeovirga aprica]NME69031.1 hypothetical protein [Flammeovirga aprica JL-4]
MTKRKATTVVALPNKADAQEAHKNFAEAFYSEKALQAEMEERIAEVREEYSNSLQALKLTQKSALSQIQLWAESNKEEFEDKRSQEWSHATIGFRHHPPKVAIVKGRKDDDGKAWNLTKALEVLEVNEEYVIHEVKMDKKSMLSDFKDNPDVVSESLKKCGLEIRQEEQFFIDVKEEKLD